jgi:hypothetical protein
MSEIRLKQFNPNGYEDNYKLHFEAQDPKTKTRHVYLTLGHMPTDSLRVIVVRLTKELERRVDETERFRRELARFQKP